MCGGETCSDQLSRARLASGTPSALQSYLSRENFSKRKKCYLGEGAAEGRGSDLP